MCSHGSTSIYTGLVQDNLYLFTMVTSNSYIMMTQPIAIARDSYLTFSITIPFARKHSLSIHGYSIIPSAYNYVYPCISGVSSMYSTFVQLKGCSIIIIIIIHALWESADVPPSIPSFYRHNY